MAELDVHFDVALRQFQHLHPTALLEVKHAYGNVVYAQVLGLRNCLPRECKRVKVEKGIRGKPRKGSITKGAAKSFAVVWDSFMPHTPQHFQCCAVSASSRTAKAATSESEKLRAISVGDVVQLKNPDHLEEHWYVCVTELISDANNHSLVGIGRWVFNQEDIDLLDPSIILAPREGILSNYAVQVHADNILDVVQMVHEVFDNPNNEDSLFCCRFLDVSTMKLHPMVLPRSVYNEMPHPEFGRMLLTLQPHALLQAGLVSFYFLEVVLVSWCPTQM